MRLGQDSPLENSLDGIVTDEHKNMLENARLRGVIASALVAIECSSVEARTDRAIQSVWRILRAAKGA